MAEIRSTHGQDILKIWPRYPRDMAKSWPRCGQDMLNIGPKCNQGLPKILPSGALQNWDRRSPGRKGDKTK